ncbi:hypothetical protein RB597_001865 [Gaeumannomyces tritici]
MAATTVDSTQVGVPNSDEFNIKKQHDAGAVDVEAVGPEKTYFSKLSVWLMILFSGLAIGSDGYHAAVIGNLQLILVLIYPEALTKDIRQRLSNAFLVGMIAGMLLFGAVADQLGRKTGAVATTALLVVGIALSAGATGPDPAGLFWMLIVAGVGAGGEYPVAGAGAAEATDETAAHRRRRGFMFAMLADLATMYGVVWRVSFALGAAPPLVIFWFRVRMAVSTAYRRSAMRRQRTPYALALRRHWRPPPGRSATWFLYNWISIPFGIFSATVVSRFNTGGSLVETLGWGLSDKIGRRKTMALGFGLQAVLGFVLGGAAESIQSVFPLFVVMYGVFLTLGEVGPGSTVVITPTECFPTSIRGQMMGLVAAWSKAGAAIGTEVFTAILNAYADDPAQGNKTAFLIGSGFAVMGAPIALFAIPEASRSLDDQDREWKKYLAGNGWGAKWGDDTTRDPSGVVLGTVRS